MKKFILKISLFLILIMLLLGGATYIMDEGLRKTGFLHYKEWNLIYQSQINADVLIMGNSRAYHHINPIIVDSILQVNSFNLGMDAAQFDLQYARFMAYMKTNKKPKIILQNIDEWTISESTLYIREQFIPYYGDSCLLNIIKHTNILPEDYFAYPLKYMGSNRSYWQIGFMEFFNIKHFNNKKIKGYQPDQLLFQTQAVDRRIKNFTIHTNNYTEQLFEKFLTFCKINNITVICFYAPIYKDGYSENTHRNTIAYYQNILSQYNIKILDFAKSPLSENSIYFRNLTHLREVGADIFTQKLSKSVDSLLHNVSTTNNNELDGN